MTLRRKQVADFRLRLKREPPEQFLGHRLVALPADQVELIADQGIERRGRIDAHLEADEGARHVHLRLKAGCEARAGERQDGNRRAKECAR